MPRHRSRRLSRARLALPPLSGSQALDIVNFLDRAIAAIWRVHGNAMAECLADLHPHRRPHRVASVPPVSAPESADDIAAPAAVGTTQSSLPF
jgi:hypothetical protein